MKKALSFVLALCMLVSLLPAVSLVASAEAETKEYAITKDMTYAFAATPVRNPSLADGKFTAKLRYDNYDAVNYAGGAAYVAFPIEAPNAGEYELQIKAYENLVTSAAPAIYLVHESELLERNEGANRNYGTTKARYTGAYTDDLRSPVGYYDFSKASTTEYTSVKSAVGSVPTVTIDKTGTYYIVICPETYSKVINPKVRNTKDSNAVVDTLANGYLNADGTVKDSSVQPANATYQQDIAISGFRLKVPSGELEERVFTYNFNYGAHGATGTVSRVDISKYTLETIDSSKSDPWEFNGWRYAYNGYLFADHVRWNAQARRADGVLITAFTIKAQEGKYVPTIEYNTLPSGFIADIYLVKKEATDTYSQFGSNGNDVNLINRINALNGTGKIGTIDMYTAEEGKKETTFDEITLSDTGEYLLLFHATGTNPELVRGSYIDAQIRKLTLTPPSMVPKDELQSFSASIAPKSVEVGGTAAITTKVTYSLSGEKVITEGVSFESSAEDVATVAADGTVTAVSAGNATITATLDGTELSDTVELEVLPYDVGNAGVIREYITSWEALSLSKLPSSNDSSIYSKEPYTRGGTIFQNMGLMNRDAVSNLNSKGETVEEYGLMNFDITAPWDMAFQSSAGGVRIMKGTNDLLLTYETSKYGNLSSGTILALRVKVPNKGKYNLYADTNNVKGGIAPAIYFAYDDGTVTSVSGIYNIVRNSEPAGYINSGDTSKMGYQKVGQVEAPRAGEYFVIFYGNAHSKEINPITTADDGKYQTLNLNGIKLSALPGDIAKAKMTIDGIDEEGDPMPLYTEKQLNFELFDALDVPFDEIDEDKLTVSYSSSAENVATVSEEGLVSALSNGTTTISATINYDGTEIVGTYELLVAPAGRNLMSHLNPDSEGDEWIWISKNEPDPSKANQLQSTTIGVVPKDGNANNRALAVNFNPEYTGTAGLSSVFFKNDGHRVPVEPGKFYQLSFKVKDDSIVPEGASHASMIFDIYTYNNPTGTASSAIAFGSNLNSNYANLDIIKKHHGEWVEIILPVVAPYESDLNVVYLTPRLDFRIASEDKGKAGFGGTIWLDDFELREVGYAGVELEILGDLTTGSLGSVTVVSKPYTSTGSYISLLSEFDFENLLDVKSSNEYVIGNITETTRVQSVTSSGMYFMNTAAKTGGMNGTCEISSDLTIHGITRTGKTNVTTSGFEIKLLYAEAEGNPATISAGEKTTVVPTGYLTDGSVADLTDATVSYQSLTPDIVTVDKVTGEVTALRAGTGEVRANIILGEVGVSGVAKITVTDSTPIVSAELYGPEKVGYLRDEQLTITGVTAGGYAADINAAEVNWTISDPDAVSIDEDHLIFGNIPGETVTVKAAVTLNGATVETNEITITVSESDLRDFMIDFRDIHPKSPKQATLEEDNWQIDFANSAAGVKNSILSTSGWTSQTTAVGHKTVFDVRIPYTGIYQIVFTGTYYTQNTEYADIYIDGIYIGDYDFYDENRNSPADPERLRTLSLTAGDHKVTVIPRAEGVNRENVVLKQFRFRAVDEMPDVEAVVTPQTEYFVENGKTMSIGAEVLTSDGFFYNGSTMLEGEADPIITMSYESSDANVVSVSADGKVTAKSVGEAEITIKATNGDTEASTVVSVAVYAEGSTAAGELSKVVIEAMSFVTNPEKSIALTVYGTDDSGNKIDMSNATVSYESSDTSVATVDANGVVTPVAVGTTDITATIELDGATASGTRTISVREGKIGRTWYSDELVAIARENIGKYDWANAEKKAVLARADRYVGLEDEIWEMIPGEGLPRATGVGYRNDPEQYVCRYCKTDLYSLHGGTPWNVNVFTRPWKVQCPECKRQFPSNDFGSLYELGRDEHGIYNIDLALSRNAELVANGERGYLVNVLYPELSGYNGKLTGDETVEGWGVDYGLGYDTGRVASNGVKEIHTYIAYYMHYGIWNDRNSSRCTGLVQNALSDLSLAYVYTGDAKYGRVGAILVDRVADLYPGYDLRTYLTRFPNSDGGSKRGKIVGCIWETDMQEDFATAYDAFFPMYDDPQVINFLNKKATKYNLDNDKATPEKIRQNIETGLLREIFTTIQNAQSSGNFGMHQSALAKTAISLDTHPDTDEMLDWIFRYSEATMTSNSGGGVNQELINKVSRDGQGDESAFGYNRIWITNLTDLANALARYDEFDEMGLYENPKYLGMVQSYPHTILVRRGVPSVGDGGGPVNYPMLPDNDAVMIDSFKYTRDSNPEAAKEIAQHMYLVKGGNFDGLHYDIWTKNPENLGDEVRDIIDTYGEFDYDKSSLLTGYGLGVLRAGTLYESVGENVLRDTQRDFWLYFGGAESHRHNDTLHLGIEAYGMPMTTDLGYPETATSGDPNRNQWNGSSIAHNLVLVDEQGINRSTYTPATIHFDGQKDSRVKVIDVNAPNAFTSADEYRRTVVMVDYDDEVSYGIDFFRILGGNDHLYAFRAASEEDPIYSDNLTFEQQVGGTYAGPDVPYGPDPYSTNSNYTLLKYPNGYTWLTDVYRADNPGVSDFWIDYKIKDFRSLSRNGKMDIHLRMTMVNDWEADEVSLVNGLPQRKPENLKYIDHFEHMLVRRKGRDLDTLFTTVIEPYNGERYIKEIKGVSISPISGDSGKHDSAKAVRVELVDGRTDYVVYTQNNEVTYRITDEERSYSFDFKGFVGVWTVGEENNNIYTFVSDGEMIGDDETKVENLDAALSGTVVDFQRDLSFDNWVEVEFDREVSEEEAAQIRDRLINFEYDGPANASFMVKSVEMKSPTRAVLNLGGITLIDSYIDDKNTDLGYNYDVAVGKSFEMPLSYEDNHAPVFDKMSDSVSANAGSSISLTVNATSQSSETIEYRARTLPRGASFDAETGTFTWKPIDSQIGENLVAIDAVDEYGRISTLYFTIDVHGKTSGGGGGGATTTTPNKPIIPDEPDTPENPETPSTGNEGEEENVRFIDLGNHAWAADSINSLADEG
ncbi:MAG: Ig-like domain-containing protein, partial [Oscillospiraceae bacterium]|nr:Ig-like domain-containing protein [Oscillospiraceae bacterium]